MVRTPFEVLRLESSGSLYEDDREPDRRMGEDGGIHNPKALNTVDAKLAVDAVFRIVLRTDATGI
jgi:hypothetical protein